MKIEINNKIKQFHLSTSKMSYMFCVLPNGELGHLYYGNPLEGDVDYTHHRIEKEHVLKVLKDDLNNRYSLEDTMQEIPFYGRGDYRNEAIKIKYLDGSYINDFVYKEHKIKEGVEETALKGLPHAHLKNGGKAMTLVITLEDTYREIAIDLYYTIFEGSSVIARFMVVKNNSQEEVKLQGCASLTLDFDEASYSLLQLNGAWARERHANIREISEGITSFRSTKGCSSINHTPFYGLLDEGTTEHQGKAYSVGLLYSGNFDAHIEVNQYKHTRAQIGINASTFEWVLKPSETFTTPQGIISFTSNGLNDLSQGLHDFIRQYIMPKRRKEPFVLLNNWEATYFDFSESKLLEIAEAGKEIGVNLFVLDDGWFGKRNNDLVGLGDWYVNKNKLPKGLEGISKKIKSLGLNFGLWIEPEMVNEDSDFYRAHPEWVVHHPGYSKSRGRHQMVLDFSNKEVIDAIHCEIRLRLKEADVDYVKWDMNRVISEPYSSGHCSEQQGEFYHRYILGVYDLYERLREEFPNVVFESCASGGGRFDLGLFYYAPQAWTSDNTDPVERLKIQTGTSYFYPICGMGTHVAAPTCHQTLRTTSYAYKSNIALFGTYGFEFDPNILNEEEKKYLMEQVEFYKKYYKVFQEGDFYRIEAPLFPSKKNKNDLISWMVVSKDKKTAICGVFQLLANSCPNVQRIYLKGLDPEYRYKVENMYYSGQQLMEMGYAFGEFYTALGEELEEVLNNQAYNFGHGDFTSKIIVLKSNN